MQGYWVELFKPRAACDVVKFLPENVKFVKNCTDNDLSAILDAARKGEARVLLECPQKYALPLPKEFSVIIAFSPY